MNNFNAIFGGCLAILFGLLGILTNAELIICTFIILAGTGLIIIGVYDNKGYTNKTYYLATSTIIALIGLILIYTVLFVPTTNKGHIYLITTGFVFLLIMHIYSYRHRRENRLKPWIDSW